MKEVRLRHFHTQMRFRLLNFRACHSTSWNVSPPCFHGNGYLSFITQTWPILFGLTITPCKVANRKSFLCSSLWFLLSWAPAFFVFPWAHFKHSPESVSTRFESLKTPNKLLSFLKPQIFIGWQNHVFCMQGLVIEKIYIFKVYCLHITNKIDYVVMLL